MHRFYGACLLYADGQILFVYEHQFFYMPPGGLLQAVFYCGIKMASYPLKIYYDTTSSSPHLQEL
jgi:hypothetical protein